MFKLNEEVDKEVDEEVDKEELKRIDNTRIMPGFYLVVFLLISSLFYFLFPFFYTIIVNKRIPHFNIISVSVIFFLVIIAICSEIKQPFLPLSQSKKTRYLRFLIFLILLMFVTMFLFLIVKLNQGNSTFEIIKNVLEGLK